ncbi:MAG: hypothetical protein JW768_09560 [Chitinispirillaceae bacterium]|nr:hypothetical protein [Chitinispirillaceae bacterium]
MNTRPRFGSPTRPDRPCAVSPVPQERLHQMDENGTLIIRELKESFLRQLCYYRDLCGIVQKIVGDLILSRGDAGSIKEDLERKRELLARIELERAGIAGQVGAWQECKGELGASADAQELDGVLQETEKVIRNFLDGEAQLKKYLERVLSKAT